MILTLNKNASSTQITSRSANDRSNHTGEQYDSTKTVHIDDNEWHCLVVDNGTLIMDPGCSNNTN